MRSLLLVAGAAVLALPVRANPIRRASLVDLCQDARVIVSGQVVAIEPGIEPRNNLPVKTITLRVREILRGSDAGARGVGAPKFYTFKQWNHPGLQRSHARLPEYRVGEQVLLFLAGTGQSGLTAPIGLGQGKFMIGPSPNGNSSGELVANALDNANLPVTEADTPGGGGPGGTLLRGGRRIGQAELTGWEQHVLTRRMSGPLEYGPFIRLVRKLAAELPAPEGK